jgi:hypothetical protein
VDIKFPFPAVAALLPPIPQTQDALRSFPASRDDATYAAVLLDESDAATATAEMDTPPATAGSEANDLFFAFAANSHGTFIDDHLLWSVTDNQSWLTDQEPVETV